MRLPSETPEPVLAYPAWSRRLGGLAAGIDLNPDGSCNWSCAYCDVPGLHNGKGPEVDLGGLESQLASTVEALTSGSVDLTSVPEDQRGLKGVLLSGRGEPTLSFQLPQAIEQQPVVGAVRAGLNDDRPIDAELCRNFLGRPTGLIGGDLADTRGSQFSNPGHYRSRADFG